MQFIKGVSYTLFVCVHVYICMYVCMCVCVCVCEANGVGRAVWVGAGQREQCVCVSVCV